MKKIAIVLIATIFSVSLMSQGLSIGPQIGFSSTTLLEKDTVTGRVDKNMKVGYQFGVAAEFEIMSFVYVGTAVTFFQKGDKRVTSTSTSKTRLGYIDIPITIGYKMPLGNVSVFGNIGPYTSVAIIGKSEYHSELMDETFPIELGGEFSSYKRFDSGVIFGGGLDFKQFQVKANYAIGFVDITSSEFVSTKNSVLNITGTYYIGRNF